MSSRDYYSSSRSSHDGHGSRRDDSYRGSSSSSRGRGDGRSDGAGRGADGRTSSRSYDYDRQYYPSRYDGANDGVAQRDRKRPRRDDDSAQHSGSSAAPSTGVSKPINPYLLDDTYMSDGVSQTSASSVPAPQSENASVQQQARKVPLSVEELLEKKKREEKEQNQPKFLSKQDRKAMAKEERQREAEQKRREHEEFLAAHKAATASATVDLKSIDPIKARELEEIRREYLGPSESATAAASAAAQAKKKTQKVGDRIKFSFEWDASEDTSAVDSSDPLAAVDASSVMLFGRGRRAGEDLTEQQRRAQQRMLMLQRNAASSSGAVGAAAAPKALLPIPGAPTAAVSSTDSSFSSSKKKRTFDLYEMGKHWSEKSLSEMTERDWRIFKEDFEIVTKGGKVPPPVRNWKEANLPAPIFDAIYAAGYTKPTPVQMQCIPIGLMNRDIIGLAETGSGKTAAFVIPMLVYIMQHCPPMTPDRAQLGPYAVVLAPTRELVQQIETEARKFASQLGLRVGAVYGGVDKEAQVLMLRDGVEILVAAPGRLVDLLESRYIVLSQCNYIVMDEADKMISMGFEEYVNKILDAMPSSNLRPENEDMDEANRRYRQTIMFSATMPPEVERLANKYLRRRIMVAIGEVGRAVERIEQVVEFTKSEQDKMERMTQILESEQGITIVFLNQQRAVDSIARELDRRGFFATGLHGGKSQEQRDAAMHGIHSGRYKVLVATDIAARGLDIKNVTLVVNYDAPKDIETYTHRIGRTGRAGKNGRAITYLSSNDTHIFYDLRKMLEDTKQNIPDELKNHEASRRPRNEKPKAIDR